MIDANVVVGAASAEIVGAVGVAESVGGEGGAPHISVVVVAGEVVGVAVEAIVGYQSVGRHIGWYRLTANHANREQ